MLKSWNTIDLIYIRHGKPSTQFLEGSLKEVELLKFSTIILVSMTQNQWQMFSTNRDYFNEIGPQLASNIPSSTMTHTKYLTSRSNKSFFFNPVTPHEVMDIIALLKNFRSKGYDEISTDTLKLCPYEVHTT